MDPALFAIVENPKVFADNISACSANFKETLASESFLNLLPGSLRTTIGERKSEFIASRLCANFALEKLGFRQRDFVLGNHPDGSPKWPDGFVGSLTHSDGFAIAAVARCENYRGLGVDSERLFSARAVRETESHIATINEYKLLSFLDETSRTTLLFSAKEAVYKCTNSLLHGFLEFCDIRLVDVNFDTKQLTLTFAQGRRAKETIFCHFSIDQNYVYTCATL